MTGTAAAAFDKQGYSRLAGRAVVAPASSSPELQATAASAAGAGALVLYGDSLPAGSLRLSAQESAPVVVVPTAPALELLAAQHAGLDVGVAIGPHDAHRTRPAATSPTSRRAGSRSTAASSRTSPPRASRSPPPSPE